MPLNSKYVLAPSLQMYFVDKDDGLPLVNGKVYFYKNNTSILKDVFTIVASGSDFTYTVLPNPSTLSAVGTFQNGSGVDILPYYYPYDSSGNIELYRVEVYDSLGVLQFTRVGWPNLTSSEITSSNDITNFVPNGQFLLHNNIPASTANGFTAGQISQDTTIIAQGGWTFERSATGATDNVSFPRYGSAISIPTGNPRYAVQIQTSVVGTAVTRRDLCLTFPDVNTFASTTQSYNFYFEAQSTTGSSISNVQIILRKNFGSGGDTTTERVLTTITLAANQINSFNTSILFGSNANKTIGTLNDDYVQIVIRLPLDGTQTALFTDFALTVNEATLASFPTQTEAQQLDPSTAGWLPVPNANGSDLYLPTILTKSGMTFDHSEIGSVIAEGNLSHYSGALSTLSNKMLANGAQYRYNDYSTLGIPYSRLGDYYISGGTAGVPQYGTGDDYATSYIELGATQKLIFSLNKLGSQTAPSNGSSPSPGFTFTELLAGSAGYDYSAYTNGSTLITAICNTIGAGLGAPSGGTSGMTVTPYRNISSTYQAIQITALSAAALGNGAGTAKYFLFSNTTISYYMWFQTATETDPTPGGTGIKLVLDLTMNATDVARVIANAMSAHQTYQITCVAASAISAGAFWQFTANSQIYVPWYTKDGVGTAPIVANSILIPINIVAADTNAQVASKTQLAVNQFYFKVPNLQGLFLRGYDPNGEWDVDYLSRFSYSNTLLGSSPGSQELDQIDNHTHTNTSTTYLNGIGSAHQHIAAGTAADASGPDSSVVSITINNTGGSESRPVNMAVVWAIKY